jgi:two-component system cell cycle response regulator
MTMYSDTPPRVILVDANDESREVTMRRLSSQGYAVEAFRDPALGADLALVSPPCALIADLWMPSISGLQLCRLLRAEPATAEMPVILRGQDDDPRSRFWARRAGAVAYVVKPRVGELIEVLANVAATVEQSDFFLQLSGGSLDIRERIASHLDQALFDSVIAAEVRALAGAGSFERFFDNFSQFLPQVMNYRWMAISTDDSRHFALHHNPKDIATAEPQAREALRVPAGTSVLRIEDEEAHGDAPAAEPIVFNIPFGSAQLGNLVVAPTLGAESESAAVAALVARELGGPLRMAALMEESQRLATTDPLTGLSNRRAMTNALRVEIAHARRHGSPLSIALLDIDHFKNINDLHGHPVGDQVLAAIGQLLRRELRSPDVPARWGGEEFVVIFRHTDAAGSLIASERIRKAIAELEVSSAGVRIPITASIGATEFSPSDNLEQLVDRADRAMYRAKTGGRNRVELEPRPSLRPPVNGASLPGRLS